MAEPEGLVSRPTAPMRPASVGGGLVVMNAQAIVERVNVIHEILEKVMVEGHHYFSFGTTKRKVKDEASGQMVDREFPQYSLGKAGAELICLTFGLTPDLESVVVSDEPNAPRLIQVSEWVDDPGARGGRRKVIQDLKVTGYYEVKSTCSIWSTGGCLLARASGSCNSCESAFVNQGYSNVKNSILKRAEKRAMVAAVLMASGAGDVFVQDLEDSPTALDGNAGGFSGGQQGGSTSGGHQQGGSHSQGWLSEAQKKLVFAKGKAIDPPATPAMVDHVIAVLNSKPAKEMRPNLDAIASGSAAGVEIWNAARKTVEGSASAQNAGTPPPPPASSQG